MELLTMMVSSGVVDGVALAELFHEALGFLIALLNNSEVSKDWANKR